MPAGALAGGHSTEQDGVAGPCRERAIERYDRTAGAFRKRQQPCVGPELGRSVVFARVSSESDFDTGGLVDKGYSVVVKDALPFALTVGNHAKCYGLNITGMKRRGYSRMAIDSLHHAFHLLLSAKLNTTQAVERITEEIKDSAEVSDLLRFIESSNRGVTK